MKMFPQTISDKVQENFMRIALAQMSMEPDMEANFQKSLSFIREASKQCVDLICFPEVQLCPFFAQYENSDASRYVIDEDSKYIFEMRSFCKEKRIYACPNFYIEENGKRYDMSLLIDDSGCIILKVSVQRLFTGRNLSLFLPQIQQQNRLSFFSGKYVCRHSRTALISQCATEWGRKIR